MTILLTIFITIRQPAKRAGVGLSALYYGKEADEHDTLGAYEAAWRESFDIKWCNQLCQLTTEFYEEPDEEEKQLLGA